MNTDHPSHTCQETGGDGDELRFTPFAESDIPTLMRATRDPDILRFTMMPRMDTPEAAREWVQWAATCPNRYAIRDSQGNLLGQVGYAPGSTPQHAEIFYWVDPGLRGRGLGTAALARMTLCVEKDTGLIPELHINGDNLASLAIARRCGYAPAGAGVCDADLGAGLLVCYRREWTG